MINPSLTRGEYWLLESVAEFKIPLRYFNWEDLEIDLNKPSHGMDRPLLINTLQKLYSEGLIFAGQRGENGDKFTFTKEQLEAAFKEKLSKDCHYYGLTKKGGQYWEAFASPNWDYYIEEGFEPLEEVNYELGELICSVKSNLDNFFKSLCYYNYDVEKESIQWDILEPWEATYWKELPMGYRVRFKCSEKEINPLHKPIEPSWYYNKWYRWK